MKREASAKRRQATVMDQEENNGACMGAHQELISISLITLSNLFALSHDHQVLTL